MRWLATWLVALAVAAAAVDRRPDRPRRSWGTSAGDPRRFDPVVARRGPDAGVAWRAGVVAATLANRSPADPLVWASAMALAGRIRAGSRP